MNIEEGVRLLREKIGDKIYNPKDEVLRRVFLHFENRVVPSMTQDSAKELYDIVYVVPGASTKSKFSSEHNISINGPWNLSAYGVILVTGITSEGVPKLLKVTHSESTETDAIKRLGLNQDSLSVDLPLVPSKLMEVDLPDRGTRMCVCMPHYPCTAGNMPQQSHQSLVQGARRVMVALEYIHARKLVHMDVKPHNIFLDMNGQWFLGDYDGVVGFDKNIVKCEQKFVWKNLQGTPAKPEYDWYLLYISILTLLHVDEAMFNAPMMTVEKFNTIKAARVDSLGAGDLKLLLEEILTRANYPSITN